MMSTNATAMKMAEPATDPTLENFERLVALSARALEAVETSDVDELEQVLAERNRLIEQTDVRQHSALRQTPANPDTVAGVSRLLRAARALQDADQRLGLAIACRRDDIERQLDTLDTGGAARTAYSGGARDQRTINIIR